MPYRILTASALLTTYVAATVLPAGSLVQCISAPDHSGIEFAHAACPAVVCTDDAEKQGSDSSELVPDCTDIPLALGASQHRIEPTPSLGLQPTSQLAIVPKLPSHHARCAARSGSGRVAQEQQPTDLLRTVVLVI